MRKLFAIATVIIASIGATVSATPAEAGPQINYCHSGYYGGHYFTGAVKFLGDPLEMPRIQARYTNFSVAFGGPGHASVWPMYQNSLSGSSLSSYFQVGLLEVNGGYKGAFWEYKPANGIDAGAYIIPGTNGLTQGDFYIEVSSSGQPDHFDAYWKRVEDQAYQLVAWNYHVLGADYANSAAEAVFYTPSPGVPCHEFDVYSYGQVPNRSNHSFIAGDCPYTAWWTGEYSMGLYNNVDRLC